MIVSSERRRQAIHKRLNDLQPGDLARRKGHRGVGIVESVGDGFAWIAWKDGRKDYLPVIALRRITPGGADYDVRRGL